MDLEIKGKRRVGPRTGPLGTGGLPKEMPKAAPKERAQELAAWEAFKVPDMGLAPRIEISLVHANQALSGHIRASSSKSGDPAIGELRAAQSELQAALAGAGNLDEAASKGYPGYVQDSGRLIEARLAQAEKRLSAALATIGDPSDPKNAALWRDVRAALEDVQQLRASLPKRVDEMAEQAYAVRKQLEEQVKKAQEFSKAQRERAYLEDYEKRKAQERKLGEAYSERRHDETKLEARRLEAEREPERRWSKWLQQQAAELSAATGEKVSAVGVGFEQYQIVDNNSLQRKKERERRTGEESRKK